MSRGPASRVKRKQMKPDAREQKYSAGWQAYYAGASFNRLENPYWRKGHSSARLYDQHKRRTAT